MLNEGVGAIIRALRLERNLTQKQLADLLHVSDKAVSKWERGAGCPDISMIPAISDLLGVDAQSLINGTLAPNDFVGGNMKNTKALCQTAVVAALYVALTTLNPLSWGAVQFRVANMLCALPFKDKRYAPAVLLGIAIANATSPFGPVDVLFGLLAEGTAYALVVWGPWKKLGILWKAVILSLSVALFIGVELSMMVGAPFWLTSAGLFVGTFLAVELGNLMISKTALAKVV